ncbi:PKD domain-containing protein [Kitasatospora sp. McL0602]|uniref:PKD domain-containing protein n=1 Tax=Kitasatospora sp. McL0602 TaxID=3439530 RepID=UPI003F8903AC
MSSIRRRQKLAATAVVLAATGLVGAVAAPPAFADAAPTPVFTVDRADRKLDLGPLGYVVNTKGTAQSSITKQEIDFGDGTPVAVVSPSYDDRAHHTFPRPGDFQITVKATDSAGHTASATKPVHVAYEAMGYVPLDPRRLYDSRYSGGDYRTDPIGSGQSIDLAVGDGYDLNHPDAVVLNLTAADPTKGGFLTVYPTGSPRPATSNVNFAPGQTVPNLVTVPVGANDGVTIYNNSGDTDVVVDLMGVYKPGHGSRFAALPPARLLDTRQSGGPVGPEGVVGIQVRGAGGVPADATVAVLNLTSTGSDAPSFLAAFASGKRWLGTSNLNFTAGQTVANQVIVPIGADGRVFVYNKAGHTQVVADIVGYYGDSGTTLFHPVVPTRLVDTRTPGQSALTPGGTLPVAGHVPAGATGAVLNVTSTASTDGGYLTVWADGARRPGTSSLNFPAGKTVPNHVTTPLGANGAFDVFNFMGRTHVVADLFGYFTK